MGEVDGVLNDVDFFCQGWGDVDCCIGDQQWMMIGWYIYQEDVVDLVRGVQVVGV